MVQKLTPVEQSGRNYRHSKQAERDSMATLQAAIVEAGELGVSVTELSRQSGLSRITVTKILQEKK